MKFFCKGHKNILATHRNTIEFTKDKELSLRGDCIVGVDAGFDSEKLNEFVKDKKDLKIKIKVDSLIEEIMCEINPDFNHKHEIIIRKSDFVSDRTLGIKADKAAKDLSREMVKLMKVDGKKIEVEICIS